MGGKDISWPSSPTGAASCTACVLGHRTGEAEEAEEEEKKDEGDRGKSYNLHTDGME